MRTLKEEQETTHSAAHSVNEKTTLVKWRRWQNVVLFQINPGNQGFLSLACSLNAINSSILKKTTTEKALGFLKRKIIEFIRSLAVKDCESKGVFESLRGRLPPTSLLA